MSHPLPFAVVEGPLGGPRMSGESIERHFGRRFSVATGAVPATSEERLVMEAETNAVQAKKPRRKKGVAEPERLAELDGIFNAMKGSESTAERVRLESRASELMTDEEAGAADPLAEVEGTSAVATESVAAGSSADYFAGPGVRAEVWNEDCIAGMAARVADNSVSLTVTSIPFEELFTYSGKVEDVGNNGSTVDVEAGQFALNLRFCIEQLFRVTKSGCNCCIHVQQLLAYKNQHGFMGRRNFRDAVINLFRGAGFHWTGEAAIVKDPQAMAQRLSLHSLQFKTGYARNSCNLAPAPNDYVLIFQKPGECEFPVRCLYHRDKNPGGWVTTEEWVLWARGCWEIDEFDILDGARSCKESDEEKHVCPLQLEIIRRCVRLYTAAATLDPGVLVLDPFMGIGSTAHESVLLGRNTIGFELKESYHRNAVRNIERARRKLEARQVDAAQPALFGGGAFPP